MATDGTCGGRGQGPGEKKGAAGTPASPMVGFTLGLSGSCSFSGSDSGSGGGGYNSEATGGSDSTFKMAPAGLASDVTRGAEPPGRAESGGGGAGSGLLARSPRPLPVSLRPRPCRCVPAARA